MSFVILASFIIVRLQTTEIMYMSEICNVLEICTFICVFVCFCVSCNGNHNEPQLPPHVTVTEVRDLPISIPLVDHFLFYLH
jgi:hypothetical protein